MSAVDTKPEMKKTKQLNYDDRIKPNGTVQFVVFRWRCKALSS